MIYTNLSTTVWINPHDPEVYPTVLKNSTTSKQYQLKIQHNEDHIIYVNAGTMKVIDYEEDAYLKELKN